jgi:serine/threonine-protein kinase
MDKAKWERIQLIFNEAVALPPAEREAFVTTACAEDAELCAEVIAMLDKDLSDTSLLGRDLTEVAGGIFGRSEAGSPAREFGPYRLKRVLGEGGMGVVWLAERADTGGQVAIKFLPHSGLSPWRRERFVQEIKTLAKLQHPLIARLYDAGALDDGTPWFVMEYVDGIRLTDYCRTHHLTIDQVLGLFRSVCTAVQYAHGQEIIHRDLKPTNILVDKDGTPRLLDFGIAREMHSLETPGELTRSGLRFLSPDYAAPEWINSGEVGFYTDVYSLGVILYEILAGKLPYEHRQSSTDLNVVHSPEKPSAAANTAVPSPYFSAESSKLTNSAWADLDVLSLTAVHHDKRQRYQSVEALIRDIDHYLRREPLEARPDSLHYRLTKFVNRNRRPLAVTSLVAILALLLIGFFTVRLARARAAANHENAINAAMNRFLTDDLLAQSDPFKSGDAKASFVDVVLRSSPQIDAQFAAEPLIAARLHYTLAKAFDSRSDFLHAAEEYRRADALFLKSEGPLSQDALRGRLRQAQMEARSTNPGSLELAKSTLASAEANLARIPHPDPDLSVAVLSTKGVIAIVTNDAKSANADYAEALREAESIPSFDPAALIVIKQRLAFTYIRLGHGAKAEALLQELIAQSPDPDSFKVAALRSNLAQALLIQGKYAEALKVDNLLLPMLVSKLGEEHELTLQALSARAATEAYLGMWDQASRDDLAVHEVAVRKQGPTAFFSLVTLSDAALSQCRAGRYDTGESMARDAFLTSQKAYGEHAGMTGGTSYSYAMCLIGVGKLDQATTLLGNINVEEVIQMTGNPTVRADIALARAEIAVQKKEYAKADGYLREAAPLIGATGADPADRETAQRLRAAIDSHSASGVRASPTVTAATSP